MTLELYIWRPTPLALPGAPMFLVPLDLETWVCDIPNPDQAFERVRRIVDAQMSAR